MKILLFLLLLIPFKVNALETSAKSSILIEYNTGTILSEENKDLELPMASMTKMMTLLITMEYIEDGKIKLNDMVTISKKASGMGGSQAYLEEGSKMSLDQLLKALCIASANDAAVAIAEYIGGSVEKFVEMMNDKVMELDLKHTSFKNVHGLDEEGHYSSAHDMAFIAKELISHPLILEYSSIYEDYVKHPNGVNTWIVNTNKLINYYEGLDGLKTGYTSNSGYCITATAKRGNMRLISVVMGEENNKIRNEDTISLLNYGFSNYKLINVIGNESRLGSINVLFGDKESVKLKLMDSALDLIGNTEKNNYSYSVNLNKVKAPVKVGDIVGSVDIYSNDIKINTIDLTVNEDIKKANIFKLYLRNLRALLKGSF